MSGREVIDRYHRAIAVGDYDTVIALHAPEVVVWMSGQSIVSGRFQGREALFAHMTHHVLRPLDATSEDYVKGTRVIVEDGDRIAVIFHGGLPNRTGGRYDQYYLQIFRTGDGLIQEIVEMFDTAMFEQAVAGNRLATPRGPPARPFVLTASLAGAADRATMLGLANRWQRAIQRDDWAEIVKSIGPNCTLDVVGTTPLSGQEPFSLERMRAIMAGGVGWTELTCANAAGAVLLMGGTDAAENQCYGLVLEAQDSHIGRVTLFLDTTMAEARHYGNAILPRPTRRIMPPFDPRFAFVLADALN